MYSVQSSKSFLLGHRHVEIIGSSKERNKISDNISDRTYKQGKLPRANVMASDVKVESSKAYLLKLGKNLSTDFEAIYIISKNVVSIYSRYLKGSFIPTKKQITFS